MDAFVRVAAENWRAYLDAILATVTLSLVAFAGALVIGVLLAISRVSPVPPLQRAAGLYTQLVRNTPLTVLMVLAFFGLPDVGYTLPTFLTVSLALAMYTGAFVGEAVRSGINTVAGGQAEAARAIGLTFGQVLGIVVLPQALRAVVGPMANVFIAHSKNTSVAAAVSYVELSRLSRDVGNATARPFAAIMLAAICYVALLVPVGQAFALLERRVAIRR